MYIYCMSTYIRVSLYIVHIHLPLYELSSGCICMCVNILYS